MKRSTYAARSAGLIRTEALENRRLFAGMPFFLGHGEASHGGFGRHEPGPRGPGADAIIISLPLGGYMKSIRDGNSTTAYSSNFSISPPSTEMANPSGGSSNSTPAIRMAPVSRTSETVAANVQTAAAKAATETPVVQQVMPDAAADASAYTSAATGPDAVANVASEPVFGPFTLGTTNNEAAEPVSTSNPGSLLTLDPDAVDRSLRWQSQDATYRPRRPANPTAASEEMSLDLAARAAMHTQQATLAPVPVELAGRPLWQRLATVAAAGLLVVTNTIVRRRQRRAALATYR